MEEGKDECKKKCSVSLNFTDQVWVSVPVVEIANFSNFGGTWISDWAVHWPLPAYENTRK